MRIHGISISLQKKVTPPERKCWRSCYRIKYINFNKLASSSDYEYKKKCCVNTYHSVARCLSMDLTLQDHVLLFKLYYERNENVNAVLREFRRLKNRWKANEVVKEPMKSRWSGKRTDEHNKLMTHDSTIWNWSNCSTTNRPWTQSA